MPKKQQLNEQLYKIHLECTTLWLTTWQLIQSTIDSKIQQQMEEHYQRLNKKLDQLLQKQSTLPRNNNKHQFYTRVKNLTNVRLNKEKTQLLNYDKL